MTDCILKTVIWFICLPNTVEGPASYNRMLDFSLWLFLYSFTCEYIFLGVIIINLSDYRSKNSLSDYKSKIVSKSENTYYEMVTLLFSPIFVLHLHFEYSVISTLIIIANSSLITFCSYLVLLTVFIRV